MYGELCRSAKNLPVSCVTVRNRNWKKIIRKGCSHLITWMGIAAACLLAIPAGLLILMIFAVWTVADAAASRIAGKGDS